MRAFNESLNRLRSVNRRETTDFLRRLGKELVGYLIRLTPPFGYPPNPRKENFGNQLKWGREAIRREVLSGFQRIDSVEMIKNPMSATGKSLKKLVNQGRLVEASEVLKRTGFRIAGIIPTVSADAHRRLMNRRGKITTKGRSPLLVVKSASVNQRIASVQRRVGYAKAGWMAAVNKLKVAKIPKWISKHSTPGTCIETGAGTTRYSITMHNRVKFGLRFTTSIVPTALKFLQGSINAQYTRLLNLRHARRRG